ncbi:glycosyltransferase [Lactobacillus sp. Sy-1]|uniref:glycosyltransferase family 2 protein n=1 Tax=Lactobacillus sp. Sy-1 TaxID=2109645 RepID=UPI00210476A5|nr:glycosyltransferase [Lactobacillus sp. Sy-1]
MYGKFIFSFIYRVRVSRFRKRHSIDEVSGSVSVIIPCYNETADSIKKLFKSLESQTILPKEVIFIDDASTNRIAYRFARKYAKRSKINILIRSQSENQGKLKAIYRGIITATGDYLLFIDSDGYVSKNAIQELLFPLYHNPKVGATCGHVVPNNSGDNFLTRMQSVLYENSYNYGRQYQSFFNKVIVCSGTLSMYRREIIANSTSELLTSRFSSKDRYTGDDITMTGIVLRRALRTIYVENAICYTNVPTSLSDFFTQQLRWIRDAYFNYLEGIGLFFKMPVYFLLQTQEVLYWLISLSALLTFVFSSHIGITISALLVIIGYDLVAMIMDNYYLIFIKKKNPFLIMIHHYTYMVLVFWIRVIGLLTMFKRKWAEHDTQKLMQLKKGINVSKRSRTIYHQSLNNRKA